MCREELFIIRWRPIDARNASCVRSSRRSRSGTAQPVRLPAVVNPPVSRRRISFWRKEPDGRTEIPLSVVEPIDTDAASEPIEPRPRRQRRDERLPEEAVRPPCQFLAEKGCTFPTDLRPFGCTAYICRPMYTHLDRATLTRIKRLVKELEERHAMLLRTLPTE